METICPVVSQRSLTSTLGVSDRALSTEASFIGLVNCTWNGTSSGRLASELRAFAWGASGEKVWGATPATCLAGRATSNPATTAATIAVTMRIGPIPTFGRRRDQSGLGMSSAGSSGRARTGDLSRVAARTG